MRKVLDGLRFISVLCLIPPCAVALGQGGPDASLGTAASPAPAAASAFDGPGVQQHAAISHGATDPLWVPTVTRNPAALDIVQASLIAMGGSASTSQQAGCTIEAESEAHSDPESSNEPVTWTVLGAEFSEKRQTGKGISVLASGHGSPFHMVGGAQVAMPQHLIHSLFIPALASTFLLSDLKNQADSFEYEGATTIGVEPAARVKISSQLTRADSRVTTEVWFFSISSKLPLRVVYRQPSRASSVRFVEVAADLSDIRPDCGTWFPHAITTVSGGMTTSTLVIREVQPTPNLRSSDFDPASGGSQ